MAGFQGRTGGPKRKMRGRAGACQASWPSPTAWAKFFICASNTGALDAKAGSSA